jgi:lysophospholipase L1-like esterase
MVWLGDSLAAGVGADTADVTMAHHVARRLAAPGAVTVEVLAVPGAQVRDVTRDQVPHLAGLGPVDLVVLSAGANDVTARTPVRQFRRDYLELLNTLAPYPVVALGIPHLNDALRLPQPLRLLAGAQSRRLDRALTSAAAQVPGVTVVPLATHRPPGRRELAGFLAADRYHPSGAGYAVWAAAVAAAVGVTA